MYAVVNFTQNQSDLSDPPHYEHRQSSGPVKTQPKYMYVWLVQSLGRFVWETHNWFWLYFWLAKRVMLVLETNHKAQLCKTSAGVNYFGTEKQKLLQRRPFNPQDGRCRRGLWPCLWVTNSEFNAATPLMRYDAEPWQVLSTLAVCQAVLRFFHPPFFTTIFQAVLPPS